MTEGSSIIYSYFIWGKILIHLETIHQCLKIDRKMQHLGITI